MNDFEHLRHKPPTPLSVPRPLVIACAPLRSNVNLSRIARAAGCFGVRRMICCGTGRLIAKIARDSVDDGDAAGSGQPVLHVETHRTLPPVLRELKRDGFQLVGLEQATHSHCLYSFAFERRTALVVGNERLGLEADVLRLLDQVVEIPVYGAPLAHNVATAAAMALYEYCRQFPAG